MSGLGWRRRLGGRRGRGIGRMRRRFTQAKFKLVIINFVNKIEGEEEIEDV